MMNIKEIRNTVYLDGSLSEKLIKELVDISYALIFQGLSIKKRAEVNGEQN